MGKFEYKDIRIEWSDKIVKIENSLIRRVMDIASGYPKTTNLQNLKRSAELVQPAEMIDFCLIGYSVPGKNNAKYYLKDISAKAVETSMYETEHVELLMEMEEPDEGVTFKREFYIYPGLAAISVRNYVSAKVMPNVYWSYRTRLRCEENRATQGPHYSAVDALTMKSEYEKRFAVEFLGRTDDCDKQVYEHPDAGDRCNGNLLYLSNKKGAGLVILQEAPPSHERRDMELNDFYFEEGNRVNSCCWGLAPHEIRENTIQKSYRHTIILFDSEAERKEAVFNYLRRRYVERPQDHAVMVNPWGCAKFPSLTSEKFLHDEIRAAASFNADCYQIDDSWQHGRCLWDMMGGNHHITRDFWNVSTTRLSGTLSPLVETAKKSNIDLALWTAPSFNVEYRDWESFADMVIKYHHEYNFNFFKIDAMVLRSYEAERNVENIFVKAREASNGKIFFNLDVTNGQRGGYFFLLEYGNIFLENRYVSLPIGIGYHPEKTLKSLWWLAKYTRTQYLQIEVPYLGAVDHKRAASNPTYHVMPDVYPWRYWGAIAMFANPLLWFAPSLVAEEERGEMVEIVELHKKYRSKIFAGNIMPIGAEPDGRSFTGFWSKSDDNGVIIVYREYGSTVSEWEIELNGKTGKLTPIGGRGKGKMKGTKLLVTIPDAADFVMFEY